MSTAYVIGLVLGALTSALVISRVLFWLSRRRLKGRTRAIVANVASAAIIIVVSVFVLGELQGSAVLLHLVAQGIWLAVDLAMEKRAA